MGRKGTARATPVKIPKQYNFEVGIRKNDDILTFIIEAVRVDPDMDSLHIYDYVDGNEVKIGEFNDWVYYFKRDTKIADFEAVKLPPNWGKIDGKDF